MSCYIRGCTSNTKWKSLTDDIRDTAILPTLSVLEESNEEIVLEVDRLALLPIA